MMRVAVGCLHLGGSHPTAKGSEPGQQKRPGRDPGPFSMADVRDQGEAMLNASMARIATPMANASTPIAR
jgi:hypothetical protein